MKKEMIIQILKGFAYALVWYVMFKVVLKEKDKKDK